MNLQELATAPQLTKLTVNTPAIVEKYGDELDFYFHDRQPLDVFAKFATVNEENPLQFIDILKDLILNEKGEPIMNDGHILPIDVLTEVIKIVGEFLGK
jgi:hypothetical protein